LRWKWPFDGGLLDGAGGAQREIGNSVGCEAAGLQARHVDEIEVSSGNIEAKLGLRQRILRREAIRESEVRGTDGGAPREWGVEESRFDVVELKLVIPRRRCFFSKGMAT